MQLTLRPKNILIIGGGSGIGYACAKKLLTEGAHNIILASRDIKKLETAKQTLSQHFVDSKTSNIYCLPFDITKVSQHDTYLEKAQSLLPNQAPIDGLIISSGINFDGSNLKGFNISESDWDKVMDTNLKGVFFLIRNFANLLFSHSTKGNICVVSSISAHRDLLSPYQIAKLAVSRLVHTYGKYLGERGIILNGVEPGPVETDMMNWLSQYTDGLHPGKPWGDNTIHRTIRQEEIAEIIYILLTQLGEPLSGSCVLAGGGTKSLFP